MIGMSPRRSGGVGVGWRSVLGVVVMAGGAALAQGAGFQTGEFYTANTAQALAGATLEDSAGVLGVMPSAMVRLEEGAHVLGGASRQDATFTYALEPHGESGSTTQKPVVGPFAYGLYNARNWAVGTGVYFPFAVDIRYKRHWVGRHLLTRDRMVVRNQAVMGAFRLNEQVSWGWGVNYLSGWMRRNQQLVMNSDVEYPVVLEGVGHSLSQTLSGLYDTGTLAAGFTYRSGTTLEAKGSRHGDKIQPGGIPGFVREQGLTVFIPLPYEIEMAVSYRNRLDDPDWMAEVNLQRSGWSRFKELRMVFDTGTPASEQVTPKNWKDTTGVRLGGNYAFARSINSTHRIRGGVSAEQSPIPPETLDPAVPDGRGRLSVALGYGVEIGALQLEAGILRSTFLEAKATPPAGSSLPKARYKGGVSVASFSAAYRW